MSVVSRTEASPRLIRNASPILGLDEAIERGSSYLLSLQDPQGYWWAELESNVTMAAEHLLLEHFLGIGDANRWSQLCRYLLQHQREDGSWAIYFGGPGDVSITTEAYFALKLAGIDPDRPAMARAREFVLSQGGAANTRIFTKLWLSLFGEFDWAAFPAMPPETILLPGRGPASIYDFASWARATVVAILVVWAYKPVVAIPPGRGVSELFLTPQDRTRIAFRRDPKPLTWRNFFIAADRMLKTYERLAPWKPFRERALQACEQWILDHQEADGSWGGIQPPWVYSLIALKCRGYSNDHPVMARRIAGLLGEFGLYRDGTFTVQPCVSPIWDTCLAITGLREAGLPADDPRLRRAALWMSAREVKKKGDWAVKVRHTEPGGWAFEFANEAYPDTDDTAEVLIALRLLDLDGTTHDAAARATTWLRAMQSSNGGWGSFDRDNTREFVSKIPFADFGATLDPPTEDVSAHVLEWLLLEGADPRTDRCVSTGLDYLWSMQEEDGSWWGRWGVNYVYGLGAVLPTLAAAGADLHDPRIRKAVRWLEEHQNTDGGWGESCFTYDEPAMRGKGTSTASQTAWALLALIAAGEARGTAAERGARFLVSTQNHNGAWDEPEFTGTGFPRDFMLNYHLYRQYWPLWALGRYRRTLVGETIHRPEDDPWR
ncbi:MAG: squalene--hopene cyclase [Thermomicrobiales bacterium]|nr:squalene--hopene cyclase [Thermomicrobiales bacterium]